MALSCFFLHLGQLALLSVSFAASSMAFLQKPSSPSGLANWC